MENRNFFVSTDGNDAWSGTSVNSNKDKTDGPFVSLERAKEAVRELKSSGINSGSINVFVRGGFYTLSEPIIFTSEDSGTELLKIRYTAYEQEKPVISGGRKILKWEKDKNGTWFADASELAGKDGVCRQLFINGQRRDRSRIPYEGFYLIDGSLPTSGQPLNFKFKKGDLKEMWADGNSEVLILENWFESRHHISVISEKDCEIFLKGFSRTCGSGNLRYCLENIKEGLAIAGTWFFDRKGKRIYYHPVPGEDMKNIEAVVPLSDCLIRFDGDNTGKETVKHISFAGFTFCYTTWILPEEGYNDRQAAYDIPAAVQACGAQECIFEKCRLTHLGGYAVEWGAGCRNNRIVECEITDVGAGGIKIGTGNVYEDQNNPDISTGNEIKNCHIHNIGIVYPAAVGVWIGQSCKNIVSHNHIHDTYYSGISAGWTWGYETSNAYGNIIEYNYLHDIARGMLSDLGAIYLLGLQPGTVIRNNVIHNVISYDSGGWGIYLDEGTGGVLVENNLVYRTMSGGFYQHYGRENVIRNNIFAFSKEGQILRSREEGHLSFTFKNNIVYCDREYPLYGSWSNKQYLLDRNLYFSRTGSPDNFINHLLYLGLKKSGGRLLDECQYFDTVQLYPGETKKKVDSKIRHLGSVPSTETPRGVFPEEKVWQNALLLPKLVNSWGQKVKNGETETRILRDEAYLYVNILCFYSRHSCCLDGIDSPKKESIEIFLKPDISDYKHVHIILTFDGIKTTYYRPVEAWQPFQWEGQTVKKGSGWRALLRIPIKKVDNFCNGDNSLWQIFVARYGLPDVSFRQWQESGQDKNSIFADPLFISPEENDFRLQKDSPAFKIGFKPINL